MLHFPALRQHPAASAPVKALKRSKDRRREDQDELLTPPPPKREIMRPGVGQ